MKNILYILTIGILLSFGCSKFKISTQNSDIKKFQCSFKGDSKDISNFLGKDFISIDNISLHLFANKYLFINKEEPLMMYTYSNKGNVFETFALKEISTQLKNYRKYKLETTDSTENSFTLNIKPDNESYTSMTNNVVIKCIAKK